MKKRLNDLEEAQKKRDKEREFFEKEQANKDDDE